MPRRVGIRLAFTFAILLTLSFPRFSWWGFAYVALFPLLDGIHRSGSPAQAFRFSFLGGFLFLVFSLLWLRHVTMGGLLTFAVLDAVAFGFFGLLTKNLFARFLDRPAKPKSRSLSTIHAILLLFTIPALWVTQEFVRANLPVIAFGFNLLGHSQAAVPVVAQSARIFGDYGLSFITAMPAAGLFLLVANAEKPEKPRLSMGQRILIITIVLVIAACVLYYGSHWLEQPPAGDVIRISTIQGNISQDEKWDLATKPLVIEKYKKLSLLAKYDGPDLMVWPEAAWPGYLNVDYNRADFGAFIQELNVPLVVGSPHFEVEDVVYNSAYLIDPGSGITARYDKVNLVPFGEYVPFGIFFRLFGIEQYARAMGVSDFAFGKDPVKVFEWQRDGRAHKFGTLICFEDGFSDFTRRMIDKGVEFLLVITNDAWFQLSAAPYQHLNCSVMRAIENGVFVVRAANTGVSAFINPKGFVEDRVMNEEGSDIFVSGGLTRPIFASSAETPFRKFGFLFPFVCILLSLPALAARFLP
ncbi:MAG: apolipoprotein N-acyltransferase [Candidatus Omnitrophica bacterium]|nr:apolipoprotein N-acyltransferase [Candidatus Omnitrophota bacterium]